MADTTKYTAFHVPRSSDILKNARRLADALEAASDVGVRVPMYAAINVALQEALNSRKAQITDQSTEVDR